MMTATNQSLRTPLFKEHVALGARMVPFAGWEMPLQYKDGILKEHDANRKGCSIFDCSHMGQFIIEGEAKLSGLDAIVTQKISDMPLHSCRYGVMLNDKAGVIDDLIIYRMEEFKWMAVVNAANIEKDRRHFQRVLTGNSRFLDISMQTAKLDLQGPLSRDVLKAIVPGVETLSYYTFGQFDFFGDKVLVSRTGYTGELGYEIYCPAGKAPFLWKEILKDARVSPTGLGVRDVLRIEMCFSLYGHELAEDITPLEAGLERFIDWDKNFVGKSSLVERQKSGINKTIAYFASTNRRSPRQGHYIYSDGGVEAGYVTSGSFSPGVGVGIGIGFIKKEFTNIGNNIIFGDEKFRNEAQITRRPFYKNGTFKS